MPQKKELEKLSSEKKSGSAIPKPKLQYLELSTGNVNTIENVRSFETADENGAWLAYSVESAEGPNKLKSEKQVAETYEVTQQGLQQASEPLKLKSRTKLALERGEEAAPETKEPKENNSATNT